MVILCVIAVVTSLIYWLLGVLHVEGTARAVASALAGYGTGKEVESMLSKKIETGDDTRKGMVLRLGINEVSLE